MNLDQLRPCDACGGPVNPVFFLLRVDQQVINQDAVRERAGMLQFFNGNNRLASVFDARGDSATTPGQMWVDTGSTPALVKMRNAGDTDWIVIGAFADTGSLGVTDIVLCTTCFCSSPGLAGAWEKRCNQEGRQQEAPHGD